MENSRVPSWRRGDSVPPIEGLEKDEECPEYRVGLGDRRLALWPIVSQTFVKVAQTGALMQRQ